MISFSCSHCGQKFSVKPEFAGRATRCPTCKQALVVPTAEETVPYVPNGQIDGVLSSVAQVGIDGGVTLREEKAAVRDGQKPVKEMLGRRGRSGQRYVIEGEIARGGMGAVLRAVDCDIRREVAVKYLLKRADPRHNARFIEEAQITGQLEHPNIPPVHELGVDAQRRVFFSMKLVRGRSLAQVLDELRTNAKSAASEWPLSRLLNVFVNICNGLAYAHSRGVIHRDLKPANVMLGDFGEVYVMDWGLAKVLDGEATRPAKAAETAADQFARFMGETPSRDGSGSDSSSAVAKTSKVVTNREAEADLTQEGSIMGTPLYMPPEQAQGRVDEIDHRSDIYSLGAILYEVLTLQPPIEKGGGRVAVLMRVVQGDIVPPERRTPERWVPRELAAIAMKALAKDKGDRYGSVEALRKDIERYQEGRSVSAKEDSFREAVVKLVKRNKLASAFTAVLVLVLMGSSWFNWQAQRETSRVFADYQKEAGEKQKRTKEAVPALVRSARLLANDGQMKEAQAQLDMALDYEEDNAEAHLLKGQILIARKDWAAGRAEVETYLAKSKSDAAAKKLLSLCVEGKEKDSVTLFAVAEVFQNQKQYGLAARLLQEVAKQVEARKQLLPLYRKQIEAAWPGLGNALTLEQNGGFNLNLSGQTQVVALDPLRGIPLSVLVVQNGITDLEPLKGMPLVRLDLERSLVKDLTPLNGMPLVRLVLSGCPVEDLTPLEGTPLTILILHGCTKVRGLTPLAGMELSYLDLGGCPVSDLTPLKGMRQLKQLDLSGTSVTDLNPLESLELDEIHFTPTSVKKSMNVLRQMKTLKTIGDGPYSSLPAAEFWKKYNDREFNK